MLLFAGNYRCLSQQINIKSISIYSKQHEKKYDIKITNDEEYRCERKEFLNLDEMNLQTIKNDIIHSDSIHQVSLYKNFLKEVPHNILDQVTYLSCLNLSHNDINLYKDNQIRHPYLRVLDLSYQEMSDTNDLPKLEILEEETEDIHKYNQMIFNSIKMRLPNLEYLVLSGNDISALLWDFNVSFPKLTRLDLVNINAEDLDLNFFSKVSTSLRVLHLENNYLRNLTLRNTAEITALYLDGNLLKKLDIISTKLRTLSLSNCTNISLGYFDTPYLEELDLSRNNFYNVLNVYFDMFRSLRILLLDYNKLSHIPLLNNLQQLKELSLSHNMIEYIKPNSFEYLASLKKLSLKGNRIERFEKETFSGLEKLEYLDLSENQLSYLSPDWAVSLIKLEYLNVNSNKFASISEMGIYAISSLKHLFVRNNTFTKVTTLEMEPLADYITIYLA